MSTVACTAGYFPEAEVAAVDLNYVESAAEGNSEIFVAVHPKSGRVVEDGDGAGGASGAAAATTGAGKREAKVLLADMVSRVPMSVFDELLATAVAGCERVLAVLDDSVRANAAKRMVLSRQLGSVA